MFKRKISIYLMLLSCLFAISSCSGTNNLTEVSEIVNENFIENETSIFLNSETLASLKMGINYDESMLNIKLPTSYKATGYCIKDNSTEILVQNKKIEKVDNENIYSDLAITNTDANITMSVSIKEKSNKNAAEYIEFIKTMKENENYKNKTIDNYNVYAEKSDKSIFAIYESINNDYLLCLNYESDNIEEINLNNFLNEFHECLYEI